MAESANPAAFGADHLRVFIAIRIPEAVRIRMEEIQSTLRGLLPGATIRWTKPEQLHLTLRFLGDVETNRCPALARSLSAVCQGFPPLSLEAKGVGCFPQLRAPRVLWGGVKDFHNRLPRLHQAINRAVAEFTTQAAESRFVGHATLGRVQTINQRERNALTQFVSEVAEKNLGAWQATEVEIVRSELSPQGAKHTPFALIPLTGQSA